MVVTRYNEGLRHWQSRKSVVISRTSLYRGSSHRGSVVCTRKKRVAHHKGGKPRITPSPLFLFIFLPFFFLRLGSQVNSGKESNPDEVHCFCNAALYNQLKEAGILNVLR